MPRTMLKNYIGKFRRSGLTFEEINELTDADLEDLFVLPQDALSEKIKMLHSLFPAMEKELRNKRVTKKLLFEEYRQKHPDGVGFSQFKCYFAQWKSRIVPSMRKEHKAGDKLFVDFAGEKLTITEKGSEEKKMLEVFVAVLGASQLTFAQAVRSQQKEDFIPACEDALHYFGGVPAAIVPDNLRPAVTKSDKYEPTINETFADFAEHYGTTILPARAYKPKDKALVEIAINILYTRVYARLREKEFHSIEELNNAIYVALEDHNNQLMAGKDYSRRQKFEEIERTSLLPLPALRYEFKKQQFSTVMKNGHVALSQDKHYYSVPYNFIGKKVKVMYSRYTVEIFHNYDRIAVHKRHKSPFNYTTNKDHLPPAHRFVSELNTDRLIIWANDIHKDVRLYINQILDQKQHPEKSHKMCLGVLTLSKKVGNERLARACRRAMDYEIRDYKTVKRILEQGLDYYTDELEELPMPEHDNIRGENYYQ